MKKTIPLTIQVWDKGETSAEIVAEVDDRFPGLAVHRRWENKRGWTITHIASGRICGLHNSFRKVWQMVRLISPLTNWKQSMGQLQQNARLWKEYRNTLRNNGIDCQSFPVF